MAGFKKRLLITSLFVSFFILIIRQFGGTNITNNYSETGNSFIENPDLDKSIPISPLENNEQNSVLKEVEKEEWVFLAEKLEATLNYLVDRKRIKEEEFGKVSTKPKSGCVRRPFAREIDLRNKYWQYLSTNETGRANEKDNANVYIYNAYLDARGSKTFVRILVASDKFFSKGQLAPKFCQIWYENKPVKNERVKAVDAVFRLSNKSAKGPFHPFLISCEVPPSLDIPESVSLVMDKCKQAKNDVKISYEIPDIFEDFGVCFRWMDLDSGISPRKLVEALEYLKIMGVGGAHFPYLSIDPKLQRIINYYQKQGFLKTKEFSLPGNQPQEPEEARKYIQGNYETRIRQELMPLLDCIFYNFYRYRYIGILGLDEILVPTNHDNYLNLFNELEVNFDEKMPTSFCFETRLFLDTMSFTNGTVLAEVPPEKSIKDKDAPFMTTKFHYDKSRLCTPGRQKINRCFHNTDIVQFFNINAPTYCLGGIKKKCTAIISEDLGYINLSKDGGKNCQLNASDSESFRKNPFGFDDRMLLFKDEMGKRRDAVLKDIINP